MVLATERPNQIDDPSEYNLLSRQQQRILQAWIQRNLVPHKIKSFSGPSSYWIKHYFEYSHRGFYISNGCMKGAMAAAGFEPKDKCRKNWTYQLSARLRRIDFAKLPKW